MYTYQITVMGCFVFSQDQAEQTDCVEVCNLILTKKLPIYKYLVNIVRNAPKNIPPQVWIKRNYNNSMYIGSIS